MGKGTITLVGADELAAKLRTLSDKVERKVLRQALRAGAKVIQAAAVAAAPELSGLLKSAIKVRVGKRKKGRASMLVQTQAGNYKGKTFYGAFQEFGWHIGKRTTGQKHQARAKMRRFSLLNDAPDTRKFIPGKHYMKNAFDAKKTEAATAITESIAAGIEREAGGK